jgi:hypothetical protein
MCKSHLKITVLSNTPSDQALKIFQEKLYRIQKTKITMVFISSTSETKKTDEIHTFDSVFN